jgi:hypothetical protein
MAGRGVSGTATATRVRSRIVGSGEARRTSGQSGLQTSGDHQEQLATITSGPPAQTKASPGTGPSTGCCRWAPGSSRSATMSSALSRWRRSFDATTTSPTRATRDSQTGRPAGQAGEQPLPDPVWDHWLDEAEAFMSLDAYIRAVFCGRMVPTPLQRFGRLGPTRWPDRGEILPPPASSALSAGTHVAKTCGNSQ